jgi:hypothetical protein
MSAKPQKRDLADRIYPAVATIMEICDDLGQIEGLTAREVVAALTIVSIEVAKAGSIGREDYLRLLGGQELEVRKHLK